MITLILTLLGTLAGIAGTIITYKFNPKNKIFDELDGLSKQENGWERVLINATGNNDNNQLNIANSNLERVRARKSVLLARLKTISGS